MTRVGRRPGAVGIVLLALLALCGCGPTHPGSELVPDDAGLGAGQSVYETRLADGNTFTCSTCHALVEPSPDRLRRPGHPIGNATRRSSWKNGKAATFLDAVNSCVTEWMVAPAWSATEPRFLALRAFLDAQSPPGPAPDLSFEIVQPPADISGGNASRGRALFNETCVVCHGTDGTGTERAPQIAGSIRSPSYVALRIRTSGPTSSPVYTSLTGGVMPFWAKDRLDDGEVRDLVAFVTGSPVDASVPVGDATAPVAEAAADASNDSPVVPVDAPSSGCPKTNPRIGYKADLGVNTGEGQVSGFVTMVDDCTLELTSFSYDGNGIDVRVFGSKSSSFRPGFIVGPDLVGQVFVKSTWSVTLPAGKTLDDLDWVAIWCVQASANFGSGPFLPP
jgi:mono/diheme cytochrome c family protein